MYQRKTDNPKMGRPSSNKTARFEIRITPELLKRLEEYARSHDRTKTDIVIEAIEEKIK